MKIIVCHKIVRHYMGWHVNTTNGYADYDVMNTSDAAKARKHVERLIKKGYTVHEFSEKAWDELRIPNEHKIL